jgi:hypothetical protein
MVFLTSAEGGAPMAFRTSPSFRAPSAWLPLAMSASAFAVLVSHLWVAGVAREADEGAAAHLWQLLVTGQLPVIAWCLLRGLAKAPKTAIPVLVTQATALMAAAMPVLLLGL